MSGCRSETGEAHGFAVTGLGGELGAADVMLVEIVTNPVLRHLPDLRTVYILANRNEWKDS
jgi:hypothetical protein